MTIINPKSDVSIERYAFSVFRHIPLKGECKFPSQQDVVLKFEK